MAIIGLWHGLTLNFLVFGLLHALFVIVTVFAGRALARRGAWPPSGAAAFGGMLLTFALMSFSQIFWRSPTWSQAVSLLDQALGLTQSGSLGIADLGPGVALTTFVCAAIALYHGGGAPGARQVAASLDRWAPRWLQYGVSLFLLSILSYEGGSKFVYGQF